MAKIGIMLCSNVSQDLGCSSSTCLQDIRKKQGEFARYEDEIELEGIINCAGCPGIFGPAKIRNRLRALGDLDVDVIHLSNCVTFFCPWVESYHKYINEQYPNIEVVRGTHAVAEGLTKEAATKATKDELHRDITTMTDMNIHVDRYIE